MDLEDEENMSKTSARHVVPSAGLLGKSQCVSVFSRASVTQAADSGVCPLRAGVCCGRSLTAACRGYSPLSSAGATMRVPPAKSRAVPTVAAGFLPCVSAMAVRLGMWDNST